MVLLVILNVCNFLFQRDSGLFDESMLEMSVHETKVVKKMARGRGRGKK